MNNVCLYVLAQQLSSLLCAKSLVVDLDRARLGEVLCFVTTMVTKYRIWTQISRGTQSSG